MTTNHTPTPYYREGSEIFSRSQDNSCEEGAVIADVKDKEHADFIVKACNAYDELVAALRFMTPLLNEHYITIEDQEKGEKLSKEALAKAQVQK